MKICIVGAGAIGGFIGTRLARSGNAVSAVARGATAAALRARGWRLEMGGELLTAPARVTDDPRELGPQDVVVIAVKAPALAESAPRIAPLLARDTVVLTAMNGVPWWFFDGIGGRYDGLKLASIDPQGRIAAAIPTRQVVGCVVHVTATTPEPGLARHGFANRLIIGEPAGGGSERTTALAHLLAHAGFDVPLSTRIQSDIWYKLWGNMTMNPISALTGAMSDKILDDPLIAAFCLAAMREAAAIGTRIGCPIQESGEDRLAVARELGPFKTSMLQDLEAGKPLEIDALLTAVHEIGATVGEPTPQIDALLGLVRLQARTRGLYP
ncbi:MAG TPA: 2-dehydropantoate 2-reductase [Stellaceae bacterium]|nr:2-dehydropantoate 2-reductase [Stellaceae bacterium]